ncbi:bifunctional [glutamate--ammonia ligase]-adenylyl-L-tyrosine phosphorylase/[glutamate--ammonia-ligase] adenylyltransferase [Acinetobacter rathckeae]|uniref:bifunctional [glutamate--ammonia ligase]-adenylyl-L-tyrosine phosphorylase/[glutamate--ammonia-ligase] adenylyltransferase n=1 Tax=Acinetobacter rathckeae TaxID=2605272 RepID=UPI0018A3046A|nr:bifunctional [glutamate--ammonia ligase]-adenylyl-L-tyrosine phosphorylase/[glutamate--ammonia-ligase] adenylyltransferase [Acinetobacter rathckeae]MBF7687782.1 bifunctional [glutamate--ammonia ligase]-adenylyl-L-tyrosine phosphorylase/[glutamate--ammonia-ligase] adenylyltransferase [Acinetobacter rathckeae]MBF7687995.1 bifunctional [glutamate--ammonia ligase]-adenylyl-L-tyrosine phosphorylase/[glutamate--ammonia-ligase] adenylyltransferase [Acinetobacter rathckeae]MBF7695951.1 bifunctional [
MNIAQLEKTQHASRYAKHVWQVYADEIQQDQQQYPFQQVLTRQDIQHLVTQAVSHLSNEHEFMKALRVLRARLMFRWIYQDVNQLTNVIALTQELSDFADASMIVAKQFARIALVEKYGEPIGYDGAVQDLIVIAMGKLGAQELNLSSDIDLIFAFDEQGETNGKKCIDVQQFCVLWGQKLIYLLDHVSADGFVFRVDMRLRPWGDGSALAVSHAALEKYLLQHGREWERYAWIKARVVSGGSAGQALLQMTRPFVFRRYVDYSAFEAMREMKTLIEREVERRQSKDDIKLGAGGIREIEFIVQVFQLIYGGSKLELQDRSCLTNLSHLATAELLSQTEVDTLTDAYLFLRRVEHAIQAIDDQQTQILPTTPELQQCLLMTLAFSSWDRFLHVLDQKRQVVSEQFKKLIQHHVPKENTTSIQHLDEQLKTALDDASYALVTQFWASHSLQKMPAKALERLKTFWPLCITQVLQLSEPQLAIQHLIPLIESIMRRSVYFVMLIESKGALQRLVKMAEVSPWICAELTQYPVLLDDFLTMDFELPKKHDLVDALRHQLLRVEIDQVEDQMRVLRLFKKSYVLGVAASDVLAESPLMKVSDALTDIAETCVQATLHLAYQAVAQRFGFPLDMQGQRCHLAQHRFAVIGYGKLGGIELGYGSDLDLVFIHDLDEQADTDGRKAITGFEFAFKVAQKFMSLMITQTLDGRAYEIDTRLRPSGEAGVLVTSIHAYARYQRQSAWLWEHQALVRARSIAGDAQLCEQFERIRAEILTQVREPKSLAQEVKNMRQKMKDHLGSSKIAQKEGIFHLKQDSGGIVDIEFMAQYIVLLGSHANPDLARYPDNVRILEDAARFGYLSATESQNLIHAYLSERATSHRRALANHNMQVCAADWQTTRDIVCKLWHKLIDSVAQSDATEQ